MTFASSKGFTGGSTGLRVVGMRVFLGMALLNVPGSNLPGLAHAQTTEEGGQLSSAIDPEMLLRRVVRSQRLSEERLSSYTYDERETRTKYDKKGLPKAVESRLFYALSGENGEEGTRELIEVNGRAATPEEKVRAAEEDAKGRKKRLEHRAAEKASKPPPVTGDEDDPLVGTRRLSELLNRYDYGLAGEEIRDGRLFYVLDFRPRHELMARNLGEKALSALGGRALIDAADFQIQSVVARLEKPVKIAGGFAATVQEGWITYEAQPVARGRWFPCVVDVHLKGKAVLLFRLDQSFRFELANFRSFKVETETSLTAGDSP